jgi:hypothetical protein
MLCLRPLCGIVFGPLAMTAGGAAFLGTLAAPGSGRLCRGRTRAAP